jgi:hypothetical protein
MVLYELRHPSQQHLKRRRINRPNGRPFVKVVLSLVDWLVSLFHRQGSRD